MRLLARGRTAQVYEWHGGQVLKRFYDWVSPDWISREAQIAAWVSEAGLPVPGYFGTVAHEGRLGLLYERINGLSLFAVLRSQPWRLTASAALLAELHCKIHETNAGVLPSLKTRLETTIAKEAAVPSDIKISVLEILGGLPDGDALCHFDFHPDQVLLAPHGPVIIDWMSAAHGNPLADVARTLVLLRFGATLPMNPFMQWLVNTFRGRLHNQYKTFMLKKLPSKASRELDLWLLPVAAHRISERVDGEQEQLLGFLRTQIALLKR